MNLRAMPVECKLLVGPPMLDKSMDRGQTKVDHLVPAVKMGLSRVNTPTEKKGKVTEALIITQNQQDLGEKDLPSGTVEELSMAYAP